MNGARKFHKPSSPAFDVGQIWYGISGKFKVKILEIKPYIICKGKWDYHVVYEQGDGSICDKDAWSFQVRYEHEADRYLS